MIQTILYRCVLLYMICLGAHAWFVWGFDVSDKFNKIIVYLFFCLIAYLYKQKARIVFKKKDTLVIISLAFLFAGVFPISDLLGLLVNGFIGLLGIFPILVLLCDQKNANSHLSFISKVLASFLIPSLVVWYYTSFVVQIPGLPIVCPYNDDTYVFMNYVFSLKNIYWDFAFPRFQSVFLEPGYLGTLLAFILFANKYEFSKWYNIVILISMLASLSLAGFILSLLGYLYFTMKDRRIGLLLISVAFGVIIYFIGISYNNGDNVINHSIIERLEYDEDKMIAGNDRFQSGTDLIFEQYFASGKLLFGNLNAWKKLDIAGAGYKIYLICYGFVSALLYLLFYLLLVKYNSAVNRASKKYGYFFVFLVVACFFQAAYPNSFSWIIPFVLGLVTNSVHVFNQTATITKK